MQAIDIDELYVMWVSGRDESSASIFRVPQDLNDCNQNPYIPSVVGLGPYHHSNPFLPNIRSHKLESLLRALQRRSQSEESIGFLSSAVDGLRRMIQTLRYEILASYDQPFEFHPDLFILDGLFLLEVCISFLKQTHADRFFPYLDHRRLNGVVGRSIVKDILKLENQIPLFVLWQLAIWQGFENTSEFARLFELMFQNIPIECQQTVKKAGEVLEDGNSPPKHLLDWIHRTMALAIRDASADEDESTGKENAKSSSGGGLPRPIPTARELKKAGVSLKVADSISFKRKYLKGKLYLPRLKLDDTSEVILRNIMAFEECLGLGMLRKYITMMSDLMRNERDVGILRSAGIVVSFLANEQEVVDLFNRLRASHAARNIPQIEDKIANKVREYYKNKIRVRVKQLIR